MLSKRGFVSVWVALSIGAFPLVMFLASRFAVDTRLLTIPYRTIVVCGALMLPFIAVRRLSHHSPIGRAALILLGSFAVLYVVRMVLQLFVIGEQTPNSPYDYIAYAVGGSFLPALALALLPPAYANGEQIARFLHIVLLATASFWLSDLWMHFGTSFGRLRADVGMNQIAIGHLGVSLALTGLTRALLGMSLSLTSLAIISLAAGLSLLLLSASRGPFVALLVCGCLLFYMSSKRRTLISLGVLSLLLLLLFQFWGQLSGAAQGLGSGLLYRVQSTIDSGAGLAGRLYLYEAALRSFAQNPWFGGTFLINGEWVHNSVLEAFALGGVFGGLIYLGLVALVSLLALKLISSRKNAVVGILYFQYLIFYLFSGAIWQATTFWMLCGLVVCCSDKKKGVFVHGATP